MSGTTELNDGIANDLMTGNSDMPVLCTLTAAAANSDSGDLVNANCKGIKLVIDITANSGSSPTLTVTIKGKDPVSGKYYTILASTALASVATTVLTVYPTITASANSIAQDHLPRTFKVLYTIGGSGGPTVTATIGACLLT